MQPVGREPVDGERLAPLSGSAPALAERIAGAVLGAAIGDALGYPVEFIKSLAEIRERYGPLGVTGYVRYQGDEGQKFARYSDDTQMAEIVLRSLIGGRHEGADLDGTMRKMAQGFVRWAYAPQGGHRAPGNACLAGCRMLHAGDPWSEAGGENAGGCGSVMRAYPFGIVFVNDPARAETWAVEHSKMTHRAPLAFAACAAMARGMVAVLRGEAPSAVTQAMIDAARRYDAVTADMIAAAVDSAAREAPESVLLRLQGWAAHEAIAAAAYVFSRHPDDPRAALLEAVNSPGDSDSIGTLVGALVGGRSGLAQLPPDWVRDVERSAELLELARQAAEPPAVPI
jgi:ADP-ribosylglycohydrolase